jgi:hypothetical protein
MKKMSLKEYGKMVAVFLSVTKVIKGQVVYTDIDPDVILQDNDSGFSLETFGIDMDEDGLEDFVFINFTNSDAWYIGESAFMIERIWAGAWDTFVNGIAAKSTYIIPYDTYYEYYPYAFEKSVLINQSWNFEGNGYQRMAHRAIKHLASFTFYITGGYWFPEKEDHYLGIRFKDTEDNMHYGWIRCTVQDTGRTLIIKDYAYEQQPDHPIFAGDTVSYVPVQEHENSATISVYSFENKVIINTSENVGNEMLISVFDSTGKKIRKVKSNQQHTEITLNVPQGIYAVEVTSEGNTFVRKVFLKQ